MDQQKNISLNFIEKFKFLLNIHSKINNSFKYIFYISYTKFRLSFNLSIKKRTFSIILNKRFFIKFYMKRIKINSF